MVSTIDERSGVVCDSWFSYLNFGVKHSFPKSSFTVGLADFHHRSAAAVLSYASIPENKVHECITNKQRYTSKGFIVFYKKINSVIDTDFYAMGLNFRPNLYIRFFEKYPLLD